MSYTTETTDYNIDDYIDLETEIYNQHNKKAEEFKEKHLSLNPNSEWIIKDISDIKVDDQIVIYFYPDSQRYINDLYPKYGKVKKILTDEELQIDEETKKEVYSDSDFDLERLIIETEDMYETSGAHGWVSYYGNSRGYFYTIYILNNP